MVSFRARLEPLLLCACLGLTSVHAAELDSAARSWLKQQPELKTWSAEVTQTRRLQSLTQPLVSQGKVWFTAPNQFRWQIGEPPATIALRDSTNLVLLYPRLRRAERYRLDAPNPLQDTLALLDAGFPRTESDLLNRFRLLEQKKAQDSFELVLEPKSAAARRLLPKLRVVVSTADWTLRATELQFADGSTMRNEFSQIQVNPSLDPELFSTAIPNEYQVTEPALR